MTAIERQVEQQRIKEWFDRTFRPRDKAAQDRELERCRVLESDNYKMMLYDLARGEDGR